VRLDVTPTPALRALCLAGFCGMTAQLLLFAEPNFALKIVDATWDKAVHFTYFGTMAFLLWIAAGKRGPLFVWLAVAAIGAADETLQAFTPGRTSDFFDWLADALGSAAALLLAQRIVPPTSTLAAPFASRTGEQPCAES
jgi:VanZ family protein